MTKAEIQASAESYANGEILMLAKAGIRMPTAQQEKLLWLRLQSIFLAGMELGIEETKKQYEPLMKGGEIDAKSK